MDRLHFERYEYKYLVPESIIDRVREFVRPYVVPDRHAEGRPGGRYAIHNIYLDTPRLDLFYAGINDAMDRFKLRIRWYDADARGPFFLEVKRKIRRVIVKDRVKVERAELDAILRGEPLSFADGPMEDRLSGFVNRALCTAAAPTILCVYSREPYESVFGDYARVTFDREVRYQDARGYTLPGHPSEWTYVDAAWATRGVRCATIIELKFTNEFPRWMSDLVTTFGLERVGYSKYGSSMLHRLERARGGVDLQRAHGWRS